MSSRCQYCSEDSFDLEEQVCKSCGVVSNEIQFGSHEHHTFTSFQQSGRTLFKDCKISTGTISQQRSTDCAMEALDHLCHQYNVVSSIKEQAKEIYYTIVKHFKQIHRRLGVKEDGAVLAGSCLLLLLEKKNEYISVSDMCRRLGCHRKKGFKFAKVVKDLLNQNIIQLLADDGMKVKENEDSESEEKCLNSRVNDLENLPIKIESMVPLVLVRLPNEVKEKIVAMTKQLLQLAHTCWLVSGRSPENCITAAAYMCYKSLHPHMKKLNVRSFCKDFKLPYATALKRVSELSDLLFKLGQEIPTQTQDYVTKKNVLFHLPFILDNAESLRNDLFRKKYDMEKNKQEYSSFRVETPRLKRSEEFCKSPPDINASDVEISDSEIESYVRTDDQVEMILSLKKAASSKCPDSDIEND